MFVDMSLFQDILHKYDMLMSTTHYKLLAMKELSLQQD